MELPNLLYIVHRFPYPPDKGDRIRAYHIIRHLAEGANLWVAALDDEGVTSQQFAHLEELVACLDVVRLCPPARSLSLIARCLSGKTVSESAFYSRKLQQRLTERSKQVRFDGILISASSMSGYLEIFESASSQIVVDLVDVDSEKWRQYSEDSQYFRRLVYQREHRGVSQLEQALLRKANAVTLVSDKEAQLFRETSRNQGAPEATLSKIHAVTNGVNLDYFKPFEVERTQSLCFLGAMNYRPNVDAVTWFVKQVWPHLRKTFPDLVFNIVGRDPASEVQALVECSGVHVTGPVDDVRPWLAESVGVVVPLRIARGIQNKVLEAMASGRAVVASPEALSGLKVDVGDHLLEAVTPDDWYYQIRKLLQSSTERARLEQRGREYVEQNHSWEAVLRPLDQLLIRSGEEAFTKL